MTSQAYRHCIIQNILNSVICFVCYKMSLVAGSVCKNVPCTMLIFCYYYVRALIQRYLINSNAMQIQMLEVPGMSLKPSY